MFHLVVDAAEVFTEDTDADELDAAEKQHKGDQGGEAGESDFESEQAPGNEKSADGETATGDEETEVGEQSKRQMRKTENAVEGIADEFAKGDHGFTSCTFLAVVEDLAATETDPGPHSGEETVFFGKGVERRDGGGGEQAEGASVGFDGKIGELAEASVEEVEAQAAQAVFLTRTTRGQDNLDTFAPSGDQVGDDFGRILQVGVHGYDGVVVACMGKTGGEGGLVAEVAREIDQLVARITDRMGQHDFDGLIATAVIHKNDCPRDFCLGGK